ELCEAGLRGSTPLDNPGPRWSGYIHALRTECGLDIETIHESHGGSFPGNHAPYVFRSPGEILSRSEFSTKEAARWTVPPSWKRSPAVKKWANSRVFCRRTSSGYLDTPKHLFAQFGPNVWTVPAEAWPKCESAQPSAARSGRCGWASTRSTARKSPR